jgi:hypothetical protein
MRSIFLSSVPERATEPIVLEVTVLELIKPRIGSGRRAVSFEGLARIDRVIKGSITRPSILVVAAMPLTFCDAPFEVGASGIVAGHIRRNQEGTEQLHAVSERFFRKRN